MGELEQELLLHVPVRRHTAPWWLTHVPLDQLFWHRHSSLQRIPPPPGAPPPLPGAHRCSSWTPTPAPPGSTTLACGSMSLRPWGWRTAWITRGTRRLCTWTRLRRGRGAGGGWVEGAAEGPLGQSWIGFVAGSRAGEGLGWAALPLWSRRLASSHTPRRLPPGPPCAATCPAPTAASTAPSSSAACWSAASPRG